jgi:hypothetical protein
MALKRFGQGLLILVALMITACGGNDKSSTPQAVTPSPIPNFDNPSDASNFIIKADTVDLAPGTSIEIQTPTPIPSEPIFGSVMIKSIKFSIPEGAVEPEIRFLGTVPTQCNKLIFKVDPIDAKNQIIIHVFTTSNLKAACLKMAEPFDQTIRLSKIPTGSYTVWFNGNKLGEYSVP